MITFLPKKFHTIFLWLSLMLFCGEISSQNIFMKTYGDSLSEFIFSAQQTTDKGFILAGYSNSYGTTANNFYLVKTDSLGNASWSKVYEGYNRDEAYSVQQTTDGGYIVAGYTRSFNAGYFDACLLKTDANGDTLWTKTYGGSNFDYGNTAIQTNDGGYIMAGYTTDTTLNGSIGSVYLVKTNSSGNIVWQKVLGPANQFTDAYSIKQTTDKGFIIAGYTNGYGELQGDAFLIKTDSLGTLLFTKTFGYKGVDWANSVQQTNDGGFILAGSYSTDSTSLDLDVYVIKTDANGDTTWTRTIGGTGNDYAQKIQQTNDGGYLVSGYTNTFGAGNYDALLMKLNASGDTVFTHVFGGANDDEANCGIQCTDGGYALFGHISSFGKGNYDFYFIKTDSNGNSSCNQTNVHLVKKAQPTFLSNGTTFQSAVNFISQPAHPVLLSGTGQTNVCNPNGIKTNTSNIICTIFPNPTTGIFNLSFVNSSAEATISVWNLLGKTIYYAQSLLSAVDLSGQPQGTYFISILAGGKAWHGKILVNK